MSSHLYIKPSLITFKTHEVDFLCDYGMCYSDNHYRPADYNPADFVKEKLYDITHFSREINKTRETMKEVFMQGVEEKNINKIIGYTSNHNNVASVTPYYVGAVENPYISYNEIQRMYRTINQQPTRMAILSRFSRLPELSDEMYSNLIKTENPMILNIIAKRHNLPQNVQLILANIKNPSIKQTLLKNPYIKEEYKIISALND